MYLRIVGLVMVVVDDACRMGLLIRNFVFAFRGLEVRPDRRRLRIGSCHHSSSVHFLLLTCC
jgi:hypothetical protein